MKQILILIFITQALFSQVDNSAFSYGEKLEYDINYKFIRAGYGTFEIDKDPFKIEDQKAYQINFEVRSLKMLEWIYKVRDRYTTIVNENTLLPYKYDQKIREGGYRRDNWAIFDRENGRAITNRDTTEIDENVFDIVSAFYFIRTMDLQSFPNDTTINLKQFYEDSTYALDVKIIKRDTVEVDAGEFNTILIEPLVVDGGLFQSEGRILIWLTDDKRKIPVKVGTEIAIGFVGAELTNYSGLTGELDAKIDD